MANQLSIIREFTKQFPNTMAKFAVFRCHCGKEFEASKSSVLTGRRTSCGEGNCNKHRKQIIGKKFGKLTVLSHLDGTNYYRCRCDCGRIINQRAGRIHSKSACKPCLIKYNPKAYLGEGVAATNLLFTRYRLGAKRRALVFQLTHAQFKTLIKLNCKYCGTPALQILKYRTQASYEPPFLYNGIDRIDNTKGYTQDNCVPCCEICNRAKSTLSLAQWHDWLHRVYLNYKT